MRGSSFRKDSGKQSVESTPINPTPINPIPINPTPINPTPVKSTPIKSTPKRAQTVDAPANTNANTSSMKRRFLSEEATTATKKQVFAKGKARSVSTPFVYSPSVSPAKCAEMSRSPSL